MVLSISTMQKCALFCWLSAVGFSFCPCLRVLSLWYGFLLLRDEVRHSCYQGYSSWCLGPLHIHNDNDSEIVWRVPRRALSPTFHSYSDMQASDLWSGSHLVPCWPAECTWCDLSMAPAFRQCNLIVRYLLSALNKCAPLLSWKVLFATSESPLRWCFGFGFGFWPRANMASILWTFAQNIICDVLTGWSCHGDK